MVVIGVLVFVVGDVSFWFVVFSKVEFEIFFVGLIGGI